MRWSFAGFANHASGATLTASTEAAAAPAAHLADRRLSRRWISNGATTLATIKVSYGGVEVSTSTVGLYDVDLDLGDVVTLRLYSDVAATVELATYVFVDRAPAVGGNLVMTLTDGDGAVAPVAHRALVIEVAGASRLRHAGYLDVSEVREVATLALSGGLAPGASKWTIDHGDGEGVTWQVSFPLTSKAELDHMEAWLEQHRGEPLVVLPQPGDDDGRSRLMVVESYSSRWDERLAVEAWTVDLTLREWTRSDF